MQPCDVSRWCEIAEVAQSCHPELAVTESDVKILLNTYSYVSMSNKSGRLIGFISSVSTAQRTTILDLCVLPEYRRRGVAFQLVSEHIAEAYESFKTPWGHEVRVRFSEDYRSPGVEFYESMGFSDVTDSDAMKYINMLYVVREPVSVEF